MYRTRCMLAALYLCLFFISASSTFSQYVKNPTFENTYLGSSTTPNPCPTTPNVAGERVRRTTCTAPPCTTCTTTPTVVSLNACADWYTPTGATPDFFHSGNANSDYRVPNNAHAPGVVVDDKVRCSTNPNSPKAYAGIWIRQNMDLDQYDCNHTGGRVREYIQQHLANPLSPNKIYKISFWVYCTNKTPNLSEEYQCATRPTVVTLKNLGVMVSSGEVLKYCNGGAAFYGVLPTNTLNSELIPLEDNDGWGTEFNMFTKTFTGKWELFEANVRVPAGVDYHYLTIGCFEDSFVPAEKIDDIPLDNGNCIISDSRKNDPGRDEAKYQSYYFIDGVEIVEIPCSCDWGMLTKPDLSPEALNTLNNRKGLIRLDNKSRINPNTHQYECCYELELTPSPASCVITKVGIDYTSDGIDDYVSNANLFYPNSHKFQFCINDIGIEIDETIGINIYTSESSTVPCTTLVVDNLCQCENCQETVTDLDFSLKESVTKCSLSCSTQCCYDIVLSNNFPCDKLIEGIAFESNVTESANCPNICLEPGYYISNGVIKKNAPFWSFGYSKNIIGKICLDANTIMNASFRAVNSINVSTNEYTFCGVEQHLTAECLGSGLCNGIILGISKVSPCCVSITLNGDSQLSACTTAVHSIIDITTNNGKNLLHDPNSTYTGDLFLYGSGSYWVKSNGTEGSISQICAPDDGRPHKYRISYTIICNGVATSCSQEFIVECEPKECCNNIDYLYITTKRNEVTGQCCHTIRGKRKSGQLCINNVQIQYGSTTVSITPPITDAEFSKEICTDEGTLTTFTVVFRDANGNVSCIKSLKGECKDCCNDITDLKYEEVTSGSEVASGQCKYKVTFTLKPNSCIRKLISPSTISFNTSSTQGTVNSFEIAVTNNQEITLVFADEAGNEVCKRKVVLPCNNCCKDNNVQVTVESYGQEETKDQEEEDKKCCYRIYGNVLNSCFNKVTCFAKGTSPAPLNIVNGQFEYISRCVPTGISTITLVFENTQNGKKCTKVLPVNCVSCCDRIGAVSIGTPVAIDPNRTNCYPISFEVDNTTSCFAEYQIINPALCFGELPAGRVNISTTSGTKFTISEMVCVCCQLQTVAQTVTIRFYKNNHEVCDKQVSIPCLPATSSCCDKISPMLIGSPVGIDPTRNTCYPISFTVDNSDNCFDSYVIWNPALCPGETMPMGSIPNGISSTFNNQVCICCSTMAQQLSVRFYKNGILICEKTISLDCGSLVFKMGENGTLITTLKEIPLMNVVPNPTSGDATLTYSISEQSNITLSLYNSNGTKVLDLESGMKKQGIHSSIIKTDNIVSGAYFIHLNVDGKTFTLPLTITH